MAKTQKERYNDVTDYLNNYVFPNKDDLIMLKEAMHEARKELARATAKVHLQEQKVEEAYDYLTKWKK